MTHVYDCCCHGVASGGFEAKLMLPRISASLIILSIIVIIIIMMIIITIIIYDSTIKITITILIYTIIPCITTMTRTFPVRALG